MHRPIDGRRNFVGELQRVEDGHVVMLVDEQEYSLAFVDIDKANVIAQLG